MIAFSILNEGDADTDADAFPVLAAREPLH